MDATAPAQPTTRARERIEIRPPHGLTSLGLRDLWRHRELLYFIGWRDVKVRYKQTFIGVAWAVLQPALTMIVFTALFGNLLGVEHRIGSVPYAPYVFAGLLPWTLFSSGMVAASGSLVSSANLVSKVYFPRLAIPLGSLGAPIADFLISTLILIGFLVWYGIVPAATVVLFPMLVALTLVFTAGVGILLSAVSVRYRDVRYAVPFAVQLGLFVTPVIYPLDVIPGAWRWLVTLNPMAGFIEGFRAMLFDAPMPWGEIAVGAATSFVLLVLGTLYFKRVESGFADLI
jgi:lipopolysaccharide transport system permease protein